MDGELEVLETPRGVEHWLALLACLAAPLGLACLGLLTTPDSRGHGTHEQLGLMPCASIELLGVPCPGCGVTTATSLFAHGRFVEAFVTQPFGFLLALAAPLAALWAVVVHLRGGDLFACRRLLFRRRLWAVVCALALAAWVWKIMLLREGSA